MPHAALVDVLDDSESARANLCFSRMAETCNAACVDYSTLEHWILGSHPFSPLPSCIKSLRVMLPRHVCPEMPVTSETLLAFCQTLGLGQQQGSTLSVLQVCLGFRDTAASSSSLPVIERAGFTLLPQSLKEQLARAASSVVLATPAAGSAWYLAQQLGVQLKQLSAADFPGMQDVHEPGLQVLLIAGGPNARLPL